MTTMTTQALTLGITGMTCGSCKGNVESALKGVPGVLEATVDLARAVADVRYDPAIATPAGVADAVRHAGYGTEAPQPGPARSGSARGGCC